VIIELEEYKQKIAGLQPALKNLMRALKLDEAAKELQNLEEESARDGFWSDLKTLRKCFRRSSSLKVKPVNMISLPGA